MNNYPEVVAKIVDDYLKRLSAVLGGLPVREREEFVREIESHLYEAFQQEPGNDDVGRILTVIRSLGDPAEVVSERLPESMVRSGARRSLPLVVAGGLLIALFGVPLGVGGAAVLLGVLVALVGFVAVYYALAGVVLLGALAFLSLGILRMSRPDVWDGLVTAGFVQMDGQAAAFLNQLSPSAQGVVILVLAAVFAAWGAGMLWVGKYLVSGLRFLVTLLLGWLGRVRPAVRRAFSRKAGELLRLSRVSWNGGRT